MKLLHKYPWILDPTDAQEWTPVEATAIAEVEMMKALKLMQDNPDEPAKSKIDDFTFLSWEGKASARPLTLVHPPWDRTALEFSAPQGVRARILTLVKYVKQGEAQELGEDLKMNLTGLQGVISMSIWQSIARNSPQEIEIRVYIPVDSSGAATGLFLLPSAALKQLPAAAQDRVHIATLIAVRASVRVLQFLNCRNVTTRPAGYIPLASTKKRRLKGSPEIVYRELVVDGNTVERVSGSNAPDMGAETRYHICRGYPADHTKHGLFGDPARKGIYWVPMHVRGAKEFGEVVKNYVVKGSSGTNLKNAVYSASQLVSKISLVDEAE